MSHFTVLVIGDNPEEQLAPFHEYECTGREDQFVVDVDKTAEVNIWLNKRIFGGKKKNGGVWDYEHNEQRAVENLVDGKEMSRLAYFNMAGLDVDTEIKDYHGYNKRGNQWIQRTNPNAKWDWYSLGGRWTGFFKMRPGAKGEIGEPGLMTRPAKPGYADLARKGNIDFNAMRDEEGKEAGERYDRVMQIFGDLPANASWDRIREEIKDINQAREVYWTQPRCAEWEKQEKENFKDWPLHGYSPDDFIPSREEYIANARNGAFATFAVVKDGQWYERGKMGWWAFVSNEKDNWNEEFSKLLDGVPGDTLLSVWDCHI